MPKKKTVTERTEAAERRMGKSVKGTRPTHVIMDEVPYGMSVANGFAAGRSTRSLDANTRTLTTVRVTPELADAVVDFGTTHQLSYSDTVRTLLAMGLEHAKEDHDRYEG